MNCVTMHSNRHVMTNCHKKIEVVGCRGSLISQSTIADQC